MDFTIDHFKTALSEYDVSLGRTESPLDILFYCYCVAAPQYDAPIRKAEEKLESVMQELSNASSDLLFDLISELALAYQRAAFLDGMKVGSELAGQLP